eukprot:396749-Pyramimonas_sp.AAC.1
MQYLGVLARRTTALLGRSAVKFDLMLGGLRYYYKKFHLGGATRTLAIPLLPRMGVIAAFLFLDSGCTP